jgi:hypothetical protein
VEFDYYFQRPPFSPDPEGRVNLQWVLPFNSRATLQHLGIVCGVQTTGDFSLLYQFDNVTSLDLIGCNAQTFQFLLQAPFHLEKFRAAPIELYTYDSPCDIPYVRAFLELVQSPVLQGVKELGFGFTVPNKRYMTPQGERTTLESAIREIAHLHALELLSLQYPLHPDWFRYFREASRLKTIQWIDPHTQRFANDTTQRPKNEALEMALRSVLPLQGDDVEVLIDSDRSGYPPARFEDQWQGDDEDEEPVDPNVIDDVEDTEDMGSEFSADGSDDEEFFP